MTNPLLMTEAQYKRLMERENRKDFLDQRPLQRVVQKSRGFPGVDIDAIHRNPRFAGRVKT